MSLFLVCAHPLFQFEAFELAGGGAGQRVLPDFVAANALGGRNLGRDALNIEANDFLGVDDSAFFQNVEVRHHHAVEPVRSGIARLTLERHDRDFLYVGRFQIVGLNLLGIYVLAVAQHDHVFLATGDKQIAARVEVAEIAGMEPAILENSGGGIRSVPIALHHNGALDGNFTDSGSAILPGLWIDNLSFHTGQGRSDRTDHVVMGQGGESGASGFAALHHHNVIGSVGPPLPGVEGQIVDPKPGEDGGIAVGEIAIKGAIVMKGYWNRPDATAAVLKDGWLHTGDLGYFDSGGNLFITGREKDVIVLSNGKNVYPEEIESYYQKSPYIKEIGVLAMESDPGNPASEHLYAVIVPDFDLLKERKIVNAKEVIRFDIEGISAHIPSTKRIGSYEIWQEALPRTTTRKLKRFELEKRVRANQKKGQSAGAEISSQPPLSAEDSQWLERPEIQQALKIIREASKTAPEGIRPSDNLELDLGLDSMQRIELLVALEKELGGDVEESALAEIYSARELVDSVLESAAAGTAVSRSRGQPAGWKSILQEESTDVEVLALARPGRFRERVLYALFRLVQMVAHDRFRMRVSGLEKPPAQGSYIISSNHQSYLDPVLMAAFLPWPVFRNLFSVGTSDIFGSGFMRRLARWLRVIVVDPDGNLVPAMRAGAFGLRHGRILILYPEGERSIDGTPRTFKKGAAILSLHLQVPIVPVAIEGFYEVWPRGKRFQKVAPLKVRFGDPIYPPPEATTSVASYEKLTAELKSRVVTMWEGLHARAPEETSPAAPDKPV